MQIFSSELMSGNRDLPLIKYVNDYATLSDNFGIELARHVWNYEF